MEENCQRLQNFNVQQPADDSEVIRETFIILLEFKQMYFYCRYVKS